MMMEQNVKPVDYLRYNKYIVPEINLNKQTNRQTKFVKHVNLVYIGMYERYIHMHLVKSVYFNILQTDTLNLFICLDYTVVL